MRTLILALIVMSTLGCTGLVIRESLDRIDQMDNEYGYLIFHFDSNWPYPNENPFLGRPMEFMLSTEGQLWRGGDTLFTKPNTLKILRLKPAEYTVNFMLIDVNFFFLDEVRVPIEAGRVTNLGTIYLTVPIYGRDRPLLRFSSISQSGFDELADEVAANSTVDIGDTKHHTLFDSNRLIWMRDNLGHRYITSYGTDITGNHDAANSGDKLQE